jgi:hypothetical protein
MPGRSTSSACSALLSEELIQQALGALQAFFREHDRFRFALGISDIALFVQAIHCIPVKALPSPRPIMQPEEEKGQDGIVYLFRIEFHGVNPGEAV